MTVSVRIIYGEAIMIDGSYAYVESEGDAFDMKPLGAFAGELGGGGMGPNYLFFRFDLTGLRSYRLRGAAATIDLYTFAETDTRHDWYRLSDDLRTLSCTVPE